MPLEKIAPGCYNAGSGMTPLRAYQADQVRCRRASSRRYVKMCAALGRKVRHHKKRRVPKTPTPEQVQRWIERRARDSAKLHKKMMLDPAWRARKQKQNALTRRKRCGPALALRLGIAVCQLCGRVWGKGVRPNRDHNHALGDGKKATRGLICGRCNTGLGMFADSVPLLRAAVRYLKKYAGPPTPGTGGFS